MNSSASHATGHFSQNNEGTSTFFRCSKISKKIAEGVLKDMQYHFELISGALASSSSSLSSKPARN